LPNEKSGEDLSTFVTSVDKVEELTGIDFFSELDDVLETKLENKSDYSLCGYFGDADPCFGDIDPSRRKWFKEQIA